MTESPISEMNGMTTSEKGGTQMKVRKGYRKGRKRIGD
jgi:hypothetical protein